MRFIITGGGTGGHLVIARALLEALKKRGHEAQFIGSISGQDQQWFGGKSDFEQTHFMKTTGVVNKKRFKKLLALWQIFLAFLRSRTLIKRYKADAVISVGGFSAAPASFAALSLRKPLFIHEQNAVEGRLNRMLKPYAKAFFSSYDKDSPLKGYPVSSALFEKARLRKEVKTVIFLGGSQGAQFLNDLAMRLVPELKNRSIHVIHQCGERDFERVKAFYDDEGYAVELYSFTKELPSLMNRSDFAISRAGASTLWELCANGLPAFYIPYPYAAGDHQYHNAQFIVQHALSWCERESAIDDDVILSLIDQDMEEKSRGLMALSEENAAENMIKMIEEMV
ncbi:MAG: undecaprenyldiphospho-muramoylpentapeptide beta-N-acetylglucosaminyltransferase [Epsilonproteobacteria bacterium]|nr:MAG: undecaprenyldiphospho-muramoylpentapeptide beta-N-acetylglucosaminyltransferase [Campylobacterota bacterium]